MNTLDEIIDYCNEPEAVGALLLTGEWGCGKTYLINNTLKDKLENIAYIIKISLFGISEIEEINKAIKAHWIETYCTSIANDKAGDKVGDKVGRAGNLAKKGLDLISKMEVFPDWVKSMASADWQSFISIKNTINGKPVILVFDDLERCRLDMIDVLGCINDYCENYKFHTIIVANQEKIIVEKESKRVKVDVCNAEGKDEKKVYSLKITSPQMEEPGALSYQEIKEKIIQRTVQYIPDYPVVVNAVISKMKYEDENYKKFITENMDALIVLFAPDSEVRYSDLDDEDDIFESVEKKERVRVVPPHNIRSLKCAICDFYRIYKLLEENDILELDKWLLSFVSYVIAYKAGIARDGFYGTIFTDEMVKKMYPSFNDRYMFSFAKKWILHGVWNDEQMNYDIKFLQKKQKAISPCDLVKTGRVIDLEETDVDKGFSEVLKLAYLGDLSLDEYVNFIMNCSFIRAYKYSTREKVDWEKICEGIQIRINILVEELPEGQQLHTFLSKENRATYSEQEWKAYLLIENFRNKNILMFCKNRSLYIQMLRTDVFSAFSICQNKRFDVFNDEMAKETAQSFDRCNNSEKSQFPGYFEGIWEPNLSSFDFDCENTVQALKLLEDLLTKQKSDLEKQGNRAFAVIHTDTFIKRINYLIKRAEEIIEERAKKVVCIETEVE